MEWISNEDTPEYEATTRPYTSDGMEVVLEILVGPKEVLQTPKEKKTPKLPQWTQVWEQNYTKGWRWSECPGQTTTNAYTKTTTGTPPTTTKETTETASTAPATATTMYLHALPRTTN